MAENKWLGLDWLGHILCVFLQQLGFKLIKLNYLALILSIFMRNFHLQTIMSPFSIEGKIPVGGVNTGKLFSGALQQRLERQLLYFHHLKLSSMIIWINKNKNNSISAKCFKHFHFTLELSMIMFLLSCFWYLKIKSIFRKKIY